jgi:hypothetical protein
VKDRKLAGGSFLKFFKDHLKKSRRECPLLTSEDMKNIFILILFIHLANTGNSHGYSFQERQWKTGDARSNCTLKCQDECTQCIQPIKCQAGQARCGEKAPKMHPDCPADEICVPMGCICKFLVEI